MEIIALAHHITVFVQLLKYIPRHESETLVNQLHSGWCFRTALRWWQPFNMTLAQLPVQTNLSIIFANLYYTFVRRLHPTRQRSNCISSLSFEIQTDVSVINLNYYLYGHHV